MTTLLTQCSHHYVITACGCHAKGARGKKCDQKTGQCICKRRVTGRACDECRDGTWSLRRNGCKQCKCDRDGSSDQVCNKVSTYTLYSRRQTK